MATKKSAPVGTSAPATPHSIPAAVRPAPQTTLDDFDALDAGPAAPVAKPTGKPKRAEVEIPKEAEDAFRRFVPAKILADIAQQVAENEKAVVEPLLFDKFCEALWKYKIKPQNPAIALAKDGRPDLSGIFQVHDKFTKNNIQVPDIKDGQTVADALVELLVDLGLNQDKATALIAEEIDMKPIKGLRDFNELIFGHYGAEKQFVEASAEEKAVGQKLMDFVKTLSPQERSLVLRTTAKTTVKKDFINRVPNYCNSADEVKKVFKVFKPTAYVSHAKFGLSDTPQERTNRLGEEARTMIGASGDGSDD